jgi:hypothetical protein
MPHKPILLALLLPLLLTSVHAQKLPNKQETSVPIPANVKINGKADEWNNQYQAYNSATQLKYTIANNGTDFYVIVNADDRTISQKIGFFGITVTVSPVTKPDSKVSLTYPTVKINNLMPLPSIIMTDSVLAAANRNFNSKAKTLRVTGVKEITDAETSIYNAFDIRIAAAIDTQRTYTCEFMIPLKYIGLAGQSGESLKFDIRINGPSANPWPMQVITQSSDGRYTRISSPDDGPNRSVAVEIRTSEFIALTQPFNFSGTYKLQ